MYFTALLARTEDGWDASENDLDDVETLVDLVDLARSVTTDDETVLVFIEQEDAWFGVVRVDGEDDPRIYVSDAAAASRSSYGEILLTDELLGRDPDDLDILVDLDGSEDGEEPAEDEDEDPGRGTSYRIPSGPVGDSGLLSDFGMTDKQLLALSEGRAVTGEALGDIAEALGVSEVLEVVR